MSLMTATEVLSQKWTLGELARLIRESEGFPEVLQALAAGHSATIGGTWGSSCALVAATLAERVPGTLFVVTAHVSDVDTLCEDIATFLEQCVHRAKPEAAAPDAGQPAPRPRATVPFFPAWDLLPREQASADQTYGQRLRLLKSLSVQPPRIVVTSIQALLQGVPSPESISRDSRRLQVGESAPLDELLRWLVEHGFVGLDAVELPGEISVRGGIFDVFPPDHSMPLRIEFFGDEIESIRSFDIESQRSYEQFQSVSIATARSPDQSKDQAS